jgi:small subunit ribosomal protein S6
LNSYELVMLLDPNLPDRDVQKITEEARELLSANGADVVAEGRVERRALAYPVKKHREAVYSFVGFAGPAPLPQKVKFEMRHREGLLRMAFVRRPMPAPAAPATPQPAPMPAPEPTPEAASG